MQINININTTPAELPALVQQLKAMGLWQEPKAAKEKSTIRLRTIPAKTSFEELTQFCRELGLPDSDAEAVYHKWTANGWTNGGKPILDWKATIRSWKAAGYMPSQKNPKPAPYDRTRDLVSQIKTLEDELAFAGVEDRPAIAEKLTILRERLRNA